MKSSALLCAIVAGAGILSAHSAAHAGVSISSGLLQIQLTDNANLDQRTLSAGGSLSSTVVLPGTGGSTGSLGVVQYNVSSDEFSLTNTSLTRTGNHVSKIFGEIVFTVDSTTNYDASGFFRFAEYGTPGKAAISTKLVDLANPGSPTTVFDFSNQNTTATVGELFLGTTTGDVSTNIGDQIGALAVGTYRWTYELIIDGVNYPSDATAVATGGLVLNFSDGTGNIPEPASVGILACASLGLLLRKRK